MIRILIRLFTALLIIPISIVAWLLLTESGLRWTLQQSKAYLPDNLITAKVKGNLIGPISFSEIEYRQDGLYIRADHVEFDWKLFSLLSTSIDINRLHVESLKIIFPTSEKHNTLQDNSLPEFNLPWHIVLSDTKIDELEIIQNDQHTKFEKLTLQASSLLNTINIKSFSFATDSYNLNIKGKLQPNKNYQHDLNINWKFKLPSNIALKGDGLLQGNLLATQLKQSISGPIQGSINANIHDLLTQPNWQTRIKLTQVNTSKFNTNLPDFSGILELNGNGDLNSASLSGNLKADIINPPSSIKTLDKKQLEANINLQVNSLNNGFEIQQFSYKSANSKLKLKGSVTNTFKLDWSADIKDLNEFYSNTHGYFESQGTITGLLDRPIINTVVTGKKITSGEYKLDSINIELKSDIFNWHQSEISAKALELDLNNIKINSLDINANPEEIYIKALSDDNISVLFKATGKVENNNWQGQIIRTDINTSRFNNWQLKAPVTLSIGNQPFSIKSMCLYNRQNGEVCGSLEQASTTWKSQFKIHKLPLQLLSPLLPPDLKIEGVANSNLEFDLISSDILLGQGHIELPAGNLSYPLLEGERDSWNYNGGTFNFSLTDQDIKAKSEITISENERFQFEAELPKAHLLLLDYKKQILSAKAKLTVNDLGLVEALLPETQDIKGKIELDLSINGTLEQPQVNGNASLVNAELKIPRLGLFIEQINLNASTNNSQQIDATLSARSGDGLITIKSSTAFDKASGWPTNIKIQGDQFKASHIPEAHILISPDLQIKVQKDTINVQGNIHIPYAKLQPKDITTAARVSDDTVIIDSDQPVEQKWNIISNTRITLGERVHFYGFGFEGRLGGNLLLTEEPGQLTKAVGEISIPEGRYRAYGQRLDVEHGRLLYTGGPLINPGLDLQAVRRVNLITAGIKVRGSLNKPQMELFSIPSMGQTDTLSYLLLGRPLENTSGEEGAMMAKAALALGLSGGDKLARVLGDKFGIDEMRVESNDTGEQASLVMGRYLSPKLYVSYGVGLVEAFNTLTLRYQIAEKWQIKAENGEYQGADFLYTIDR